jgi:hypothetical protein
MGYLFKYTATRSTWGGSVNAGESFTIEQSSSGPSGQYLVNHLRKMGREVKISSSIGKWCIEGWREQKT